MIFAVPDLCDNVNEVFLDLVPEGVGILICTHCRVGSDNDVGMCQMDVLVNTEIGRPCEFTRCVDE